ncbi:hydroxyacid dehydrogenase [Mycolicibacterium insubricum]|uniref:Hydroxyacid dehydrogenase n=1 Tax=Mycolicibacterium insubricum TaxID=444597 RepID=A0A1X0DNP3_9MYCO|nr:2-hydroxyacid dehydrogenase [Mycolicibacterium insubricum]ORA74031.1 hydroxyacid dehydrogenase [Mycolicibacterium insubricum]BBZ67949.1 hydroxyacid dehydrogenase [Mycolicibacterium insubricum]
MSSGVLQVGPLIPSLQEALRTSYDVVRLPDNPGERPAFLAANADAVRVIVTAGVTGSPRIDAELIASLPRLAAVVYCAVGYDSIDLSAAAARSIRVSNTPDVLTDCVADAAVGLLIDVLRGFSAADRYLRAGRWVTDGPYPLTRRVTGSRVGILGLGRIGAAIARRLEAFDCRIGYHNRTPVPGCAYQYFDSPTGLAHGVDVLVVATPGGAGTRALVDADVLAALGETGYLINIARGSVVDESALADALTSGRLAGAGLDVFAHEPNVPEALLGLDNVVLLPHMASATVQTRAAMAELALRNLASFCDRGELVTPVEVP